MLQEVVGAEPWLVCPSDQLRSCEDESHPGILLGAIPASCLAINRHEKENLVLCRLLGQNLDNTLNIHR